MIGIHYDEVSFNCAHFVAKWYEEKLNIKIPIVNEFGLSFFRWMRSNFEQVDKPIDNCLVLMDGNSINHIGIYCDYSVFHNYKINNAKGSVVNWELGTVKRNYNRVTFWKWKHSTC